MHPNLHPRNPILLVDDDEIGLSAVRMILETAGYSNIRTCSDSRRVRQILEIEPCSVVVLDLVMPYISGPDVLSMVQELQPHAAIIFVSGINDVQTAVDLLRRGAHDYLTKPFESSRLLATIKLVVEKWEIQQENLSLRDRMLSGLPADSRVFEKIVTRSPQMTQIFSYVEAIAPTSLPMLIVGETGVGKELLAEALHRASGRPGPFVPVNAAGLDDALFSDALFGHTRGAFTNASQDRRGFIAQASGGTLFLDELGDLPLESQVKILRLIQNKEYYPIGSDKVVHTDARFVFATNQDLGTLIEEGKFRKDLYYRLGSHRVAIPPLRERPEDIPPLVDFFFSRYKKETGQSADSVDPEIYSALCAQQFPGNIRELEGRIADALVRAGHNELRLEHFGLKPHFAEMPSPVPAGDSPLRSWPRIPTIENMISILIDEALARTNGNQGNAAKILGISRSTLNKRIHQS